VYTSGTTLKPKGVPVPVPVRALDAFAYMRLSAGLRPDDVS
jgi:acyl-coenzyme A synthetase/AMP-(fatty) acid ligase